MPQLLDPKSASDVTLEALLARMGCAVLLGALVAWRPLSLLAGGRASRPDVRHAVLLMTIASSLVIVVIGDSLARAFGVVGLGSFIRFRTSLKDPSDVVLFFIAIGVGMACGLGLAHLAAAGVVVISLVFVARDRSVARTPVPPLAEPPPEPVVPQREQEHVAHV